jgi:hypothetical protein
MKATLKRSFLICFAGFSAASLHAQSQRDSAHLKKPPGVIVTYDSLKVEKPEPAEKKKSYLEASLGFQSDAVYLGRKDSSILPYYIPAVSYHLKSGLYFSAYVNYLKNDVSSQIDLITLEGGYVISKENYEGQLTLSKFVYNSESTNVSSEIMASMGLQNSFDFGFIKPGFSLNFDFGTRTDYLGNVSLEHGFNCFGNKLEMTPTVSMNAGTQHYYDNYYKNKGYSNRKKDRQNGSSSVTGNLVDPSTFKILDYEASVPMSYTFKKLVINFTPVYAIPVNPAQVDVQTRQSNGTSSSQTVNESISNTFYWTLGVSFRIG